MVYYSPCYASLVVVTLATSMARLLEPLTKDMDPNSWLDRFEAAISFKEVKDDKKSNALISSLSSEVYDLLADALIPLKPTGQTFDQLVNVLKAQMRPQRSAIASRYHFHQLKQEENDSPMFMRHLRCAAADCEFGNQLDDRLRDQFIFGLANDD